MPGSFSKDRLRFLMTTEIQDLGLTSHPKDIVLPTMQFPRVSQNSKAPYPIGCSHGNTASGFHKEWRNQIIVEILLMLASLLFLHC